MAMAAMMILVFSSVDANAANTGGRASGNFRSSAQPQQQQQQQHHSQEHTAHYAHEHSAHTYVTGGGSHTTVIVAPPPPPVVVYPSPFSPVATPFAPFSGLAPLGAAPLAGALPAVSGTAVRNALLLGGAGLVGYKIYRGMQDRRLGAADGHTRSRIRTHALTVTHALTHSR